MKWGRWGSNPRPRDYEVGANGRTGPVVSDWSEKVRVLRPVVSVWSEKVRVLRPVVSVWSGGVGLVCGMKRGIPEANFVRVQVQFGEPTSIVSNWKPTA